MFVFSAIYLIKLMSLWKTVYYKPANNVIRKITPSTLMFVHHHNKLVNMRTYETNLSNLPRL